ncbi:MAG: putative Cytoplasmic FMR1-interacting protein 2, partial [Streblomastix strix]
MQEAAEQVRRQLQDSVRPALVALPSVQPQVAPAVVLTQVRENDLCENPWRFIDTLRFEPQVRKEAQLMKQMQAMSAMADEEAKKIYIHRSLALVLSPLLSAKFKPDIKAQIDALQIDLLTTEVNKFVNFKDFTARFSESLLNISRIIAAMDPKKMICTEPFLYQYMKTLDKLLLLNELCYRKESPSNEISHRKRVMASKSTPAEALKDKTTQELQLFFADKNSIIIHFRKAFHMIPGGYIPMVVVCNLAAELYNRHVYITPEEKYMLIRVLGLGLYLIEGAIKITEKDRQTMYDNAQDVVANGQVPDTNQYKNERVLATFHKGGLNLDLIKTILYENQNVPLIFECFVDSLKLVRQCKDFSWDDAEDKSRVKKEKMNISEAASVYGEFVCSSMGRITVILRTRTESKRNRVRLNNPQMIRQGGEINQQSLGIGIDQNGQAQRLRPKDEYAITADNRMILSAFEEAIRILSEMKQFLMEFLATKFAFPINEDKFITEDDRKITTYELSVRYNLSFEEKTGLCKLIIHITEFREFLLKNVVKVKREIDSAVFGEVQELCQLMLRRVIYKSVRNKKSQFSKQILDIREVAASWSSREAYFNDPALDGKEDRGFTPPTIGVKCAPIHPTQLFILQSNIANIASPRSPSLLKSMFSSAEIEPENQQVLFEWLIRSFAFPHLLNIDDCIRTIGDLGQLWYREDFIDRGKAREEIIQFPIESSLPWILTTHILNFLPSLTDSLLAIFDLYSAAADTALRQLKSRYLFDEIESEAKLGMKQMLYILSNNIYSYYKKLASAKLVETSYREVFDSNPRVVKGNGPQQIPAPQQGGDQQQQGGNENRNKQGYPNTTQQGEAQIVPVQNDQERYLFRKGGEKMVG